MICSDPSLRQYHWHLLAWLYSRTDIDGICSWTQLGSDPSGLYLLQARGPVLTVFHQVGTQSSFSVLLTENETKHHKTKQMQPHRACTTPVRGHINGWHSNQNGTEQCQSQSTGTDSDREKDRNKSWKRHGRVMASCFEDRDRDEHGDRYGNRKLNWA